MAEKTEIKKGRMITLQFTEAQYSALRAFYFDRVRLESSELPAYFDVRQIIEKGVIKDGE